MVPRLAAALAVLLSTLAVPAAATAQTPGDCNWAGDAQFPAAIGLFDGDAWDPLGANQVGFGFDTDRPTGYAGPGSWTVNVDWGDGTTTQSFAPGSTGSTGPLPEGRTAPPVWVVHLSLIHI